MKPAALAIPPGLSYEFIFADHFMDFQTHKNNTFAAEHRKFDTFF